MDKMMDNKENFIKRLSTNVDEPILKSVYFSSENMKKTIFERKEFIIKAYNTDLKAIADENKESVDAMLERWEREYTNNNRETTIKTKIKELIQHYPNDDNSLMVELIHYLNNEFGCSFEQQYLEQLLNECKNELIKGR